MTYSLIYGFLKKQSQSKAADAVKKAARSIIVLKDDFQPEGPPLDEIVKQWKESHAKDSSCVFTFPMYYFFYSRHEKVVPTLTVCIYCC